MRINRFLSQSGITSRRKAEELVRQGRIKVNLKTITDLATTVDPEKDTVAFDNEEIKLPTKKIYLMLNKPKGYVTTAKDTHGRPTVFDLLSDFPKKVGKECRLFSVGRLDMNSRGLLLLTNDGDWAHGLTHPRHKVEKTYEVVLNNEPKKEQLELFKNGVDLEDGKTQPARIKIMQGKKYAVIIKEGRKRQVRRMFEAINNKVTDLKRTQVGDYELGDLKEGEIKEIKV